MKRYMISINTQYLWKDPEFTTQLTKVHQQASSTVKTVFRDKVLEKYGLGLVYKNIENSEYPKEHY